MNSSVITGQAQNDILAHIKTCGDSFSAWYCGIAADPRDCLFNRHGVDELHGAWIYRNCGTDTTARQLEQYLHSLGCKGAYGGGGPDTRFIYAYRITGTTRE